MSRRRAHVHRGRFRLVAGSVLGFATLAALLLAPASALAADGDVTIAAVSDPTWTVDDADGAIGPALALPGAAQRVCLNDASPAGCPADATRYGWPGAGWSADLASIPGAWWIWAPGVTGATSPADNDTYTFTRTIDVPGTPTAGSVSIAADDGAQVAVNGTSVGSSSSPNTLSTFDVAALLVEGDNTIVVTAANGPICGRPCTYAENPAAVAIGVSITYAPAATATPAPTVPAVIPTTPPTSTSAGATGEAGGGASGLVGLAAALAIAAAALAIVPVRRTARAATPRSRRR